MFAARHSNGLYLATSARLWIFFSVRIFTFLTDSCRFFFKILTLPDAEFNSVSVSFTKTWKFFQFSHYFSIFQSSMAISSNWANCQYKVKAELNGRASVGRQIASARRSRSIQASSRDQIGRASTLLLSKSSFVLNIILLTFLTYIFGKEAFKGENNQEIVKSAQNSHYLTLTTIWQRLAGNLKILPRSSR